MKPIIQLRSISEINNFAQCTTNHPLVDVFDFSKTDEYKEYKGKPGKATFTTMSKDEAIAKQLWVVSEKLVGLKYL